MGNTVLQPALCEGTVEVGHHLLHGAWRQGHAVEAARAVLHDGFHTLRLAHMSAVVHATNAASRCVTARLDTTATGALTLNGMPHRRHGCVQPAASGM